MKPDFRQNVIEWKYASQNDWLAGSGLISHFKNLHISECKSKVNIRETCLVNLLQFSQKSLIEIPYTQKID